MTEKDFALELKNEYDYQLKTFKNIACLYYPNASIPVENFDLNKLQEELKQYNLFVSRGRDLGHISQDYVNDWNNEKTIFIYANESDL